FANWPLTRKRGPRSGSLPKKICELCPTGPEVSGVHGWVFNCFYNLIQALLQRCLSIRTLDIFVPNFSLPQDIPQSERAAKNRLKRINPLFPNKIVRILFVLDERKPKCATNL